MSKIQPKLKSYENLLAHTQFIIAQSFWNFAQSMAAMLPCSVQNFKMFGEMK